MLKLYYSYLIFIIMYLILGYILSKEAVRRFVDIAIPHKDCRQDDQGSEDVEIGWFIICICL